MVSSTSRRRILPLLAAVAVALVPALTLQAQQAQATAPAAAATRASATKAAPASGHAYSAGRYIVTFNDEPAASYDGYAKGFPATRPGRGHKFNGTSAASQKWRAHLTAKHDAALAKVGAGKIYDFTVTNNAVTANLTAKQANQLAKSTGVLALTKDALAHPDTTESPHFLGLDAVNGIWSQLGGGPRAGAGLVVGVIDTGIWPENPYFKGGTGIPVPATWHGTCVAGQNFPKTSCNDKLVGARYYVAGFGKKFISKAEYLSPRDGDSHGSHTSSTAAGNFHVPVTIDGKFIGFGSGMAPGAKVAMYKVCWTGKPPTPDGCFNSDSVAAINDAIADGVDVINYSIGGSSESSVFDPVEQAFRAASNANVFVANSAGNSGPGASTLDHPSPWLTTVAAATFRRAFQVVELGNGQRFVGASTTPGLPTFTQLVTSVSVKLAGATDHDAALCFAGSLDPAKAAGKVVQCDRGVNARIDKSFEVQRAGGVGMVLTNTSPNSLNGDYHPVPSVHVPNTARTPILSYIAAAGASATAKIVPLTPAELEAAPQVPEITDFSSRGPSTTTGGDILKPDIAAPGNDVVAAAAPAIDHGRNFDFMSGTSMASPHIAGIGALIKARHPSWLPSEIKSAIMTSARDTVSSANDPFAQGAGFVNPNGAADPGLVYPTTANEYRQYLVGQGAVFAPPFDTLTPISGPNLNQASIAVGAVPGSTTVTRRVRNVEGHTTTYTATASVPGFTVAVTPSQLTLASGEEGSFTVTFTRDGAAFDTWAIGSLTWTGGGHAVRSPIALRAVPIAAPAEVHADASAAGSQDFSVTPGFTGPLSTTVSGLVGVTPTADSVATGPFDTTNPVAGVGTNVYHVTVPAGTRAARFSLDAGDDTADLDLFVYSGGNLVDLSASGSADEQVTLANPDAGTYDVYVNGFSTPGGSTSYGLANFVVDAASAGNASVSPNPAAAVQGTPTTLTASWTGLDPAKRWFGVINYTGTPSFTYLSVG
ncbi:MAG: S8 family serine peptidase [Nocardioidaceae bacterium]|nr:S8 family serine peptidase [Nocardioidaceae bacterium]